MTSALEADREFFRALVAGDHGALERLLDDDFVLVDVMGGSEVTKPALLGAMAAGQIRFESIEPSGSRERVYESAVVVNGTTPMSGQFGSTPFSVDSRYTHV